MNKKVWVSLLIVLGGAVFAYLGGSFTTQDYREMRRSEEASRDSLAGLRREVDSLKLFRDSLAKYPAVQERVARQEFGMLRPGELSFKIVVDSAAKDSVRRDGIRP